MPHFLFHFLISGAIKYQETRSEEKMNGKLKCKQNHLSHLIPMPHTRVQLKSARMKIQKSNCFAMKKKGASTDKKERDANLFPPKQQMKRFELLSKRKCK